MKAPTALHRTSGVFSHRGVAALLVMPDKKYLMQLRDDTPGVNMPGHWGLFGGWVKENEDPEAALIRELQEELEFRPSVLRWFTDIGYIVSELDGSTILKIFYEVPLAGNALSHMKQREGADMKLFSLAELLAEPRTLPWDVCGVMLHARNNELAQLHRNSAPFAEA